MWQKVRSSFYSFQCYMRHLAGFRDSLSFRTEREATQPLCSCAKRECAFPGAIFKLATRILQPFHLFTSISA